MKLTKHDVMAGLLALVILLTLILLPAPAHAATVPYCYRTKTGVVCITTGGSGITVVRRVWKH